MRPGTVAAGAAIALALFTGCGKKQTSTALPAPSATPGPVAAPTPAPSPYDAYLYVSNLADNDLSVFKIDPTSGTLRARKRIGTGTSPLLLAVAPSARFLYVSNYAGGSISQFKIDPATGELEALAAPVGAGANPVAVIPHPSGKFLYATSEADGVVRVFKVEDAGTLTYKSQILGLTLPGWAAVHPSGQWLWVAEGSTPPRIRGYSINAETGALTEVSGSPFPAVEMAHGFTLNPDGSLLYTITRLDFGAVDNVRVFSIDAATGKLGLWGRMTFGRRPQAIGFLPSGERAYVVNKLDTTVTSCLVDRGSGHLTPFGHEVGVQGDGGMGLRQLAFEPAGGFAYVSNPGTASISSFIVDPETGALIPSAIYQAGLNSYGLAIAKIPRP